MDPTVQTAINNGIVSVSIAVVGACVFILTALIYWISGKVVTYLKSKTDPNQLDLMKGMAASIIKNLEQSPIFKDFDGPAKKEQAILDFTNWANKAGIPVSKNFVDMLVEEAVADFNIAIGKYDYLKVFEPFVDKLEPSPTPESK